MHYSKSGSDAMKVKTFLYPIHNDMEHGHELTDNDQSNPIPIVLWHGMGDTCCNPMSLGKIKKILEENIPGVYVTSLKFGSNFAEDIKSGYFARVNSLIQDACNSISSNKALLSGYHAVGFSQGGQFLRAVAQRCPLPPMINLVTLGGQHQGVYGLPRCPGEGSSYCDLARKLLNYGAYTDFVQNNLVQAQYWHDPLAEKMYREKSLFLADINNERHPRNDSYKNNLKKLNRLVMIKFNQDSMVDPPDSEIFGFFEPGQSKKILPMNETLLYTEDWIGLKSLDVEGKVKVYEVEGDHLEFDMKWFINEIIEKYLK